VSDLFQYLYFPRYAVNIHLILNFVFFENFNGHFFLRDRLNAELNFTKSSFSKGFVDEEMGNLSELF